MAATDQIAPAKSVWRRRWDALWQRQRVLLRRLPVVGTRLVRKEVVKRYRKRFGAPPRLDPPLTFNERVTHRIIYDRDPRLKIVCDKIAVKHFIRQCVGPDYVVPTLGVWEHPGEIDWRTLPEQFVLKPSHAAGQVAIVRQPADRNIERLAEQAKSWLARDYFDFSLEWGYRGIPRRLLAEPLLVSRDGGYVVEAQIYTFFGKAALIRILVGRKSTPERKTAWFDVTGRPVAIGTEIAFTEFDLAEHDRRLLSDIAEKVSTGFQSMRVDCYIANDALKIGELTAYNSAGKQGWQPHGMDGLLGQLWRPDFDLSLLPGCHSRLR